MVMSDGMFFSFWMWKQNLQEQPYERGWFKRTQISFEALERLESKWISMLFQTWQRTDNSHFSGSVEQRWTGITRIIKNARNCRHHRPTVAIEYVSSYPYHSPIYWLNGLWLFFLSPEMWNRRFEIGGIRKGRLSQTLRICCSNSEWSSDDVRQVRFSFSWLGNTRMQLHIEKRSYPGCWKKQSQLSQTIQKHKVSLNPHQLCSAVLIWTLKFLGSLPWTFSSYPSIAKSATLPLISYKRSSSILRNRA